VLVFGWRLHRVYLESALFPRRRLDAFRGGVDVDAGYVTLRRPVALVLPDHPHLIGPLALCLLIPPVAIVLRRARSGSMLGSLLALHVVVVSVLLALPSYAVYVAYALPTMLTLVYILPTGGARTLFTAGVGLTILPTSVEALRESVGTTPMVEAIESVLRIATPQLVGLLLTLAAAVLAVGGRSSPAD
jgi:hypothetical protein